MSQQKGNKQPNKEEIRQLLLQTERQYEFYTGLQTNELEQIVYGSGNPLEVRLQALNALVKNTSIDTEKVTNLLIQCVRKSQQEYWEQVNEIKAAEDSVVYLLKHIPLWNLTKPFDVAFILSNLTKPDSVQIFKDVVNAVDAHYFISDLGASMIKILFEDGEIYQSYKTQIKMRLPSSLNSEQHSLLEELTDECYWTHPRIDLGRMLKRYGLPVTREALIKYLT